MDKKVSEQLKAIADSAASALGLQVLHFVGRGTDSRPVIEITLDGNRLVKVEDCERVSSQIQSYIDEHLGENVNYRLDVLSPGIDEPIIYDFQLERSIGRTINVKSKLEDTETEVSGILRSFTPENIELEKMKQVSRGQAPKAVGVVTLDRASILSMRQVAVIR